MLLYIFSFLFFFLPSLPHSIHVSISLKASHSFSRTLIFTASLTLYLFLSHFLADSLPSHSLSRSALPLSSISLALTPHTPSRPASLRSSSSFLLSPVSLLRNNTHNHPQTVVATWEKQQTDHLHPSSPPINPIGSDHQRPSTAAYTTANINNK